MFTQPAPLTLVSFLCKFTFMIVAASLSALTTRPSNSGATGSVNLNHVADMVKRQRTAPINEFEISHDSDSNTWHVTGSGLQRFVQMTNWRYEARWSLLSSHCVCQLLPPHTLPFFCWNDYAGQIKGNHPLRTHNQIEVTLIYHVIMLYMCLSSHLSTCFCIGILESLSPCYFDSTIHISHDMYNSR